MNWMYEEDEIFRPPQYFVNGFSYSVNDDDALLEVRRYDKCFYITLAPEDFANPPPIKQQYLEDLAAERADTNDDDNIFEDLLPIQLAIIHYSRSDRFPFPRMMERMIFFSNVVGVMVRILILEEGRAGVHRSSWLISLHSLVGVLGTEVVLRR